jgi:uncharacterized protein
MKKAIWIDVDNSPHVPLFAPLIRQYRENGVEVILTARNHSQTIELLENTGFGGTFTVIGEHYGKSRFHKVRGLLVRMKQLVAHLKRLRREFEIKVAVSHGSRSLVLAAKWLKIPVITMYDYEFTETVIFNRFSDKVLVPEKIPDKTLDEIGLPLARRVKYQGLKEELYLNYFQPDQTFWNNFVSNNNLKIAEDTVLVALRPPATTANYHNETSEVLFRELLQYLLGDPKTLTIISPRTDEQRVEIENLLAELNLDRSRSVILKKAVSGLDLALNVDLLISGGGTMNREAVLLGTKVYSIFAGKQGALDLEMEKGGLITFIRDPGDVKKIRLEKAEKRERVRLTSKVEDCVREQINYWF